MKDFEKLQKTAKNLTIFSSIGVLLQWDQDTYMPPGAIEARSAQIALLCSHIHKERTGKKFQKALEKLIDLPTGKYLHEDLSSQEKIALREWRRDFLRDTKLPNSFVKSFAQLTSESIAAWSKAKKERKFSAFAPYLKKIVTAVRKKADILGYENHPYDALIDIHEPGMTAQKLDTLLSRLKHSLAPLLQKIASKTAPQDDFLFGSFPHDRQMAFGRSLTQILHSDPKIFRLDESAHPFSLAIHPTDARITTRVLPDSLMSNIFAVLHECGHAFYELGLPKELYGTPLAEAASLGIHESQSRWWETRIGKSKGFWRHVFPFLQKSFPELSSVSFDAFYRAIHVVKPSLIRIEADEVTYPLHVVLRYELEKDLLTGALNVDDLPEAWKEKSKELLGITPSHDGEGCLQDIHWSMGELGYFPTYTLGNLYASHFFERFEKDHPDWEKKCSEGDFLFIRKWLTEHIHQYGRSYLPEELAVRITGKPLSEKAYVDYLSKKYGEIYNF